MKLQTIKINGKKAVVRVPRDYYAGMPKISNEQLHKKQINILKGVIKKQSSVIVKKDSLIRYSTNRMKLILEMLEELQTTTKLDGYQNVIVNKIKKIMNYAKEECVSTLEGERDDKTTSNRVI